MKKIITLALVLMLIMTMAIPAFAVTPPMQVPDMPEIPDISDDVHVELPDEFWDNYFEENPLPDIEVTEPTEPPSEDGTCNIDWHYWLNLWKQWFPWFPWIC